MTSHRLGFIFGTLSALLVHHVHADTPYPIISYECSSRENVLNIHFEVIYDHPVGGYHDSALNGVYDMSKYVRTKIIGGRYIYKAPRTIKRSCSLSSGTYDVVIEPVTGGTTPLGRCGLELTAAVSISRGGKVILAKTGFGSLCEPADDEISTVAVIGSTGLAEIHMLSDSYPLHKAIEASDVVLARALLDSGQNINELNYLGSSPLGIAIEARNTVMCEELINRGANKNEGLTFAARQNLIAIARLLLSRGADVNGGDSPYNRGAPLHAAASNGYVDIVRLLIANHVDVNQKSDTWFLPPAIIAAARGLHFDAVQYLIESGANVNITDTSGDTALIWVVRMAGNDLKSPYWKLAKLLIDNGASPSFKGRNEKNAMDNASISWEKARSAMRDGESTPSGIER